MFPFTIPSENFLKISNKNLPLTNAEAGCTIAKCSVCAAVARARSMAPLLARMIMGIVVLILKIIVNFVYRALICKYKVFNAEKLG